MKTPKAIYKANEVIQHKGYYVSVAFNSTFGDDLKYIDETALVFNQRGKRRFWILKHDARGIYSGLSLLEAKRLFVREAKKGNQAFWSDYDSKKDKITPIIKSKKKQDTKL